MADYQQGTEELANLVTNVRHFMWNDDYIELLSHKLDLQKVRYLVDIGSGLGYLSGLFAIYMRAGATVHGLDLDAACVKKAQAWAVENAYSVNVKFEQADAHTLPLADDTADLAICQHVLTHVADPGAILAEMRRVVKPGGRVVSFEPNSIIQSLILDSVSDDYTLEDRLNRVRFQYYFETGKQRLGDGDDSVGDQLPRLFLEAGLTDIEVRLSDKAAALIPPYDTPEKQARVQELLGWLDSFEKNRSYIRRCFLEGGGTEAEFEAFTASELREQERVREQIADGRFVYPGGMLTYIVIGRVPGTPTDTGATGSGGTALSQYQP